MLLYNASETNLHLTFEIENSCRVVISMRLLSLFLIEIILLETKGLCYSVYWRVLCWYEYVTANNCHFCIRHVWLLFLPTELSVHYFMSIQFTSLHLYFKSVSSNTQLKKKQDVGQKGNRGNEWDWRWMKPCTAFCFPVEWLNYKRCNLKLDKYDYSKIPEWPVLVYCQC